MTAARHYRLEDRPRAVFFCLAMASLLLSGCSLGSGRALDGLVPGSASGDVSDQAAATSYASLDFHVEGHGGLVILASQVRDMTYWQFRDSATVALKDGYLHSSAGLEQNLIDTSITGEEGEIVDESPWRGSSSSIAYRLTREWQTADGDLHHGQATALLDCDAAPSQVELPLMSRALQVCHETVNWEDGNVTHGTLWRAPEDGRLWAVETQPWPGAPIFDWQVARPW
ncbi:YjbF family lipoprotein [Salinicola lusitanus]|uniref:YjbF family lipoprotein n=1 Tax=Salinicola lusitanus TaxID=1949085 RepID=UPI000DA1324B|nr:YjbF family lipoprotein [Salinicola lusitanus]